MHVHRQSESGRIGFVMLPNWRTEAILYCGTTSIKIQRLKSIVHAHGSSGPSYSLLEFFSLSSSVLIEFFKVFYALFWCSEGCFLTFLSLKKGYCLSMDLCKSGEVLIHLP